MTNNSSTEYGAQFDNAIIVIMSIAIIASLFAVIYMNKATHPDCTSQEYTYCGETKTPNHH